MMSLLASISPLASTMTAPALADIGRDLRIESLPERQFTLSIFSLGYAVGPLFLTPFSERYGRVWVAQLSNLWFLIFNTVCGLSKSSSQLLLFRFLAGLGSSTTASLGAGVLADCYQSENLGTAAAIYSALPILAPVIGPIIGGFLAQHTTWRWIFYAVSSWDVVVQIITFFLMPESYAPLILQRKLQSLQRDGDTRGLYVTHQINHPLRDTLRRSVVRPLRLLLTQPLIQTLAVYLGFLNGVSYIVETTFPTLWTTKYRESESLGSLNYIALGVGAVVGAQICSYANDKIYQRLSARNGGLGSPDFRLPTMLLGALIVPIGMFWYGWSAEKSLPWIMPDIGGVIFYAGFLMGIINVHMYVIDFYGSNSASAMAAVSLIQSLFGGVFPLFGEDLYDVLGYGWGNSLIGFITLTLGLTALALLWRFGGQIRDWSTYAKRDQND
jgi:multidrug resistance protein